MISILKKIRNYFRNPKRIAASLPFAKISSNAILLDSTRFDFRKGVSKFKGKINVGQGTMFGGEFIFESEQGEVNIGDHSFINGGTKFISRSKISIGNHVTVAWNCIFYDHNSHSIDYQERQKDIHQQIEDYKDGLSMIERKNWSSVKSREINVGDNVWIGFDSVILSGVTIGEGAIIGARSVVRENVEPWTIVAGNPAQLIKRLK